MTDQLKAEIDKYVTAHEQEFLLDLRRLIQIPSVAVPGSPEPTPFGEDVAKVLSVALDMAREKGMRPENHGNWYGLAKKGSGRHAIGIFSHLDVVEVDDRWIYPPFDLTIKDGFMIGRGSNDDKLAAVIGLHVGQAMEQLGIGRNIELQLYLGCCEEKGMPDLERYLAEQKQPEFSMVPDFLFPVSVGESGRIEFTYTKAYDFTELTDLTGGKPGPGIPLSAEVLYTGSHIEELITLVEAADNMSYEIYESQTVRGTAGSHSGLKLMATGRRSSGFFTNDAVSAIDVLLQFLSECPVLCPSDRELSESIYGMVQGADGSALDIAFSDQLYGNLSCRCNHISSEDGALSFLYNARFPGSLEVLTLIQELETYAKSHELDLTIKKCSRGSKVDPQDPRVQLINNCRNEVTGKNDKPWAGGGTYAGRLENAVAFGPKETDEIPILPEGHGWLHGPDEAMNIADAMNALRIYIRAVAELDEYYEGK